jgi:LTXXQ motif family protein
MAFVSTRATRTAVFVIGLSGAGLWALSAMDAKADPPPMDDSSPCAEGRALFAAKLAYLEAKISPEPSQEEAWRSFAGAMRASAGAVDRACVEDPPRPITADAGERLKHMERHAAATQAMFGAMADAYVAIAPNLTEAQRDILSRNIVPSPFGPRILGGRLPRLGDMAGNCGHSEPASHGSAPPSEPWPF